MKDLSGFHDLPLSKQNEMLNGPAMKPPTGIMPNFADPPNHNEMGIGILIAVAICATLLVASRIYARIVYHKKIAIEDGAVIAALGTFATFIYFTWKVVDSPGLLVHQWNVQFKDMPKILYHISSGSTVYGIVIMLLKIGILLHWADIFVPDGFRNVFWWTCHITIWINVLFYVICTFIELFGCTPRAKLWDITLKGKCMDMPLVIVVSAFINFFSDVIILLLPQRVIWSLNLSTRRKIGTAALFAVGIFATVCAGWRIKSTFDFAHTEDVTYVISELGLWCIAEMMAGFFVLCLPSLPKLFKHSPWIRMFIASLKSMSRSKTYHSGASPARKATQSWPRSKPRRAPDASLFTDTGTSGFVQLTEISRTSESKAERGISETNLNISKIRTNES